MAQAPFYRTLLPPDVARGPMAVSPHRDRAGARASLSGRLTRVLRGPLSRRVSSRVRPGGDAPALPR